MNNNEPLFVLPSELSDETAYELLNFLQALTTEIENHYAAQIQRYLSPQSTHSPISLTHRGTRTTHLPESHCRATAHLKGRYRSLGVDNRVV